MDTMNNRESVAMVTYDSIDTKIQTDFLYEKVRWHDFSNPNTESEGNQNIFQIEVFNSPNGRSIQLRVFAAFFGLLSSLCPEIGPIVWMYTFFDLAIPQVYLPYRAHWVPWGILFHS